MWKLVEERLHSWCAISNFRKSALHKISGEKNHDQEGIVQIEHCILLFILNANIRLIW
jgi:hypothetical protein